MRRRWYALWRGVLHWWVRSRVLPDPDGGMGASADTPVCYVLNDYALSSILILDKCCEDHALARPLAPIPGLGPEFGRAYAVLRRMHGLFVLRRTKRRSSELLRQLVDYVGAHEGQDVQVVPVTVFVGRAPDKETGFAKILFSENWEVGGRLRRLLSTLINGRDTLVQFSRPISLRELCDEGLGPERSLRKVTRILRAHFRLVRASAIGPDLSHRRTVIDQVLRSPAVREAMEEHARKNKITPARAQRVARKFALEVAADYSYRFIRLAFFVLQWFLHRVYDGIRVLNVERLKEASLGHEVVYVPCHRSHMDYLLMSFILYQNGFVPPHVAAGVNLNLPVIGSLIRGGGAFYLRRTFRSQKLYAAVFNEYLRTILARGVSIEYFVEGTRSRTGRLLPPRGGMLAMTVRGYLASPVRPVMFQPVYIGYEQMVEAESYIRELSGRSKRTERLTDLLKVFGVLRRRHGEAALSFGQPIFLDELLDAHDPSWRSVTSEDTPLNWLSPLVEGLGERIMRQINASCDVNSVNLLATIMLATPQHAMDEDGLLSQIDLYKALLLEGPYGETISLTERDGPAIVDYGFELGFLHRRAHPLGDILSLAPEQAAGLTYFRNNVLHLFAIPSLIACCLLNQRTCTADQLRRICTLVYPFLQRELFLPWDGDAFATVLQASLEQLAGARLLAISEDGATIVRAEGGSLEAGKLGLLARCILPTMERYFITVAVLTKNGSGTLSRAQLERLCALTAERINRLHGFDAPEFADQRLFREFIAALRDTAYLTSSDAGALQFGEQLKQMGRDAHFILSRDIRHSILRIAPQALESAVSGVDVGD